MSVHPRHPIKLCLAVCFALLLPSFCAAASRIEASRAFLLAPGVELRTVTELSRDGWLRYAVISVDTASAGVSAGPFNAEQWIDEPASVMDTVRRNGLLAAVNGDFFDYSTGMPLSMVVVDGTMVRSPRKDQDFATLCIPAGGEGYIGRFTWSSRLVRQDGSSLVISALNEFSVGSSDAVLYSNMRSSRRYPPNAAVALFSGNEVVAVAQADAFGSVAAPGYSDTVFDLELVATGAKSAFVTGLLKGETVRFEFDLFPPYPMDSAFSGKPVLLETGIKAKGLKSFTSISGNQRAPRTMAGVTWAGKLLLVAVEGRSEDSIGMTLDEAADLMIRLGARDALNLDGGGSTQLAADGGKGPIRLIGSDGADRKVSYSIGVRYEGPSAVGSLPSLAAHPPYGNGFEIPPLEELTSPGKAYGGIIEDLPTIITGTSLYLPEDTPDPQGLSVSGPVSVQSDGSFAVEGTGPVEISFAVGGRKATYRMLAASKPVSVSVKAMVLTADGLSFTAVPHDAAGRPVNMPAAGLRAVAEGDLGSAETTTGLFPADAIEGIGNLKGISFYFGGELVSYEEARITGLDRAYGDGMALVSGMDDASAWVAASAPEGALVCMSGFSSGDRDAIEFSYDFGGTGIRAVYIKPKDRLVIPEGSTELRIMVNADLASGHWLRANVRDERNERQFLDFGRLAGQGWNEYRAALPAGGGSFSLEQVYLVEFRDDIRSEGTVILDSLTAVIGGASPDASAFWEASAAGGSQAYVPCAETPLPLDPSLVSQFGLLAVPGDALLITLGATGGSVYKNGIQQMQRLIEACTSQGRYGSLVISVGGLDGAVDRGAEPLARIKDANERAMLKALAARALFMGYKDVTVMEYGAVEALCFRIDGAFYISVP